ncbi:MAG TPA: RDD family protein [Pyrinomonadaceae bacterium]|jgi:uncharacterized RDD family membrane protein YckC|nr:RDD family protein [Pyrinomonadaceae bacterium]
MYQYQTVAKRFWAGIIDGLVFLPLTYFESWLYSFEPPIALLVAWIIISYPLAWLYSVILHARYGQTLGKMVMGIKVVDVSEERPITWRQAFLRDIALVIPNTILLGYAIFYVLTGSDYGTIEMIVNIAVLVWFVLEIVSALTNHKRRAIHDFIAGTVVITTARKEML